MDKFTSGDDEFDVVVDGVKRHEYKVLVSKHADYGPQNIARAPGGPLMGLAVRLHDKLARLTHILEKDGEPNHESLADTLLDIANYGTIGQMVVEGEWPGVERPHPEDTTEDPDPSPEWLWYAFAEDIAHPSAASDNTDPAPRGHPARDAAPVNPDDGETFRYVGLDSQGHALFVGSSALRLDTWDEVRVLERRHQSDQVRVRYGNGVEAWLSPDRLERIWP